jgi:hypothetical protein
MERAGPQTNKARPASGFEPLSIGEIADRAAQLYRREFLPLFSIAMLPEAGLYVVTILLMLTSAGAAEVDSDLGTGIMAVGTVITSIIWLFVSVLRFGALTWCISEKYFGRPAPATTAFRIAAQRWVKVLATGIIAWAAILLGFFVGLVPGAFAAVGVGMLTEEPLTGTILAMMTLVPFLGLGFFFFLRFLFAIYPPIIPVIEKQWAFEALRRSWRLMTYRDSHWGYFQTNSYRATALFLLLFGIFLAVIFIGQLPYMALVIWQGIEQIRSGVPAPADPTALAPLWLLIPVQALAVLAQALGFPYTVSIFVIYYWDLRVRREGYGYFYDLETSPASGGGAG